MSSSRSGNGFTLVEVVVATLVLSLSAMGMAKLVAGHHRVLEGIDDWADGEPTYYVDPSDDAMERALGLPAELAGEAPESNESGRESYPYDVLVLITSKQWDPPKMTGIFARVAPELQEKGKGGND